jgi:4-hydroxy-2-oxoheptanedioate aldolase
MVPTRLLRETWADGRVVLNAWVVGEGPSTGETLARAGFDTVTLDLQHGTATIDAAAETFRAIELAGAVPFARAPWNDPAVLMRILDLGARGVICPMVGSADEAEAFVRACRFPPRGIRSYGPVRGALGAGVEHVRRSDESVLLFAMIETAEGFAALEGIAATPGLDGLFVGPADLSLGLGFETFADLADARTLEAVDAVVAAAHRHDIVPGIYVSSPERGAEMASRGFRFVTPATDAELLARGGEAALEATRRLAGAQSSPLTSRRRR